MFKINKVLHKNNVGFIGNYPFNEIKKNLSSTQTKEFCLPLANAKHGDNGIMFYGRMQDFEWAENCIEVVANGAVATGDVYPQPHKIGVLWDAYLVKPEQDNREVLMYIAAALQLSIKSKYGYENKSTWNKVKEDDICLPMTDEDQIDFDYMKSIIRVFQKLTIKNVQRWRCKQISVVKELTNV
jgi:hypothetical protein